MLTIIEVFLQLGLLSGWSQENIHTHIYFYYLYLFLYLHVFPATDITNSNTMLQSLFYFSLPSLTVRNQTPIILNIFTYLLNFFVWKQSLDSARPLSCPVHLCVSHGSQVLWKWILSQEGLALFLEWEYDGLYTPHIYRSAMVATHISLRRWL